MRPSDARSEIAIASRRLRMCSSICSPRNMIDPDLIGQDSDDGRAHRAVVAEFFTTNNAENLSLGN